MDNNLEIRGYDFSEEELEKYLSPASSTENFETTNYKEIPDELIPFFYTERLAKKFEGQVVLPLKKRRKLSQFSDNASIKDDDIQYLDSQRINFNNNNREVYVTGMKNEGNISYPSTPMLSIANFENMIFCPYHKQLTQTKRFKTPAQLIEMAYPSAPMLSIANFENMIFCPHHKLLTQTKRFKTPAELKEMVPSVASVAPVSSISTMISSSINNPVGAMNLQTFNILSNSTPHAINVNNGRNCNDIRNTGPTFNLLQPQQTATFVNNSGDEAGNVQTFNIIPSQGAGINMSRNNETIQNIQQTDMNNENVNFNLVHKHFILIILNIQLVVYDQILHKIKFIYNHFVIFKVL